MLVLEAKPSTLQKDSFPVDFSGEDELAVACQLWGRSNRYVVASGQNLVSIQREYKA